MSGIAGIIHFNGAPVAPGQVEKMTAAMAHRGPDGIHHWVSGSVALGQCMLRTTPESLEETQPLTNEDASLVLVMDGRVDNWEELRRELLGRGAVLRTRADAELVLRAYEIWGEACPDRIIGEFTFFIWDARQRRLFAARDAAGTRHFYFHAGNGWFAFASEIKGLLALDCIEPKLNESRLLDYLVPEFDRDDVVGTFYQGIDRMPAGHAMTVTQRGVKTWRYWNPGDLPENRFASQGECAEAFLDQLRVAVKCRLRSIGPVGAMLSGGLDSSSIVGLIGKEFREELGEPLRTFSLIREDRENCPDWQSIQHMLKDGWLSSTILTSAMVDDSQVAYLDAIRNLDEPFAVTHGLNYHLVYNMAGQNGCRTVLDGMAGDLHFYGPERSFAAILQAGRFAQLPAVLSAYRQHGLDGGLKKLARATLAFAMPEGAKALYRMQRDKKAVHGDDLKLLSGETAMQLLSAKHSRRNHLKPASNQADHARNFTEGLLSFSHEVYGQIAFAAGVEPRSPFSDRRMIEFAIGMPLEAKLFATWYKPVMRKAMEGILPDAVRRRRDIGGHPGWKFYERLISLTARNHPDRWHGAGQENTTRSLINDANLERDRLRFERTQNYDSGYRVFRFLVLSQWLEARSLSVPVD